VALKAVDDCADLRSYLSQVIVENLVRQLYWRWPVPMGGAAFEDDRESSPNDYTSTNVQEEGVDELDLVKTDGYSLFVTSEDRFAIVQSWPPEQSRLTSEMRLNGHAHGLFKYRDLAVVFSDFYDGFGEFAPESWGGTRIELIDVSDRARPTVVRTIDIEGYLVDARLIDGHLYAVLSSYMQVPVEVWELLQRDDLDLPELDWDATDEEREAAAASARRILRPLVEEIVGRVALDRVLPILRDWTPDEPDASPGLLVGCGDLFRPAEVSEYSVLSVLHIDLDAPTPADNPLDTTGLLSDGWIVYASADSLYIAQSSWWWWWGWGPLERTTAIHKFELASDGKREVRYAASGRVEGWLLNQFSMSEHRDHLRVATTEFDWWGITPEEGPDHGSLVTVLRDNGAGELVEVGRVDGIAPGERIYACRFLGDTAYLVTFFQVDPLFTLDLSDPANPRIVGELEVTGFSSYLHPIDDDHLLAVGMETDEQGRPIGLAVSVFDVSDPGSPSLDHRYLIEDEEGVWSWSEALDDHHAFTYHRSVLSIPAYLSGGDRQFSGLVVMLVDPELGITELGRIDHSGLPPGPYRSSAWMRRSTYIEDAVYSLSNLGIMVNLLYRPDEVLAEVPFFSSSGTP
jgi:hypothetical protein